MYVYYPYFRAKKFEVKAVVNAANKLAQNGKILPIFECVTKKNPNLLVSKSAYFSQVGLPVALVMNPKDGELQNDPQVFIDLLTSMRAKGAEVWPTLIVDRGTTTQEVNAFSQHAQGHSAIYIHTGIPSQSVVTALQAALGSHLFVDGLTSATYHQGFSAPQMFLLRDGFKAERRNSDYQPRSFFDDLHLNYQGQGYQGFGDYNIIGREYKSGGGPALAVALHLTEEDQYGIGCNHFLSSTNQTRANPGGKFLEALSELMTYSKQNPGKIDFSDAHVELDDLHNRQHFPGLGDAKRLSMQHHLELMHQVV